MTTCPRGGLRLESPAIVAAFLNDPQWSFGGVEGCRWIVCRGAGYVHFRVQIDGRMYHRLATIAPEVTTPAPRPTEKPLPPLPLFEPRQEDWLP